MSARNPDGQGTSSHHQSEPRQWQAALRPVGYLVVAVIWVVLTLITLGLGAVLPLAISDGGTDPHMAEIFADQARDPGNATVGVAVVVVLVGPVLGYVLVRLPLLTAPLAALSATYTARALRPSYRHERLSFTALSTAGFGPATTGTTALSLQAVRATRWTRFWMRLYRCSWGGGGLEVLIQAPFTGSAYLLTVCWLLWPVHGALVVAGWSLLSVAVAAPGVVLAVRHLRRGRRSEPPPAETG